MALPQLNIKHIRLKVPIIQGGMGAGISMSPLAKAVAEEGGLGVISSVALDILTSTRVGKKLNMYEATVREILDAKVDGGYVGINIMVALVRDYESAVKAAIDAEADAIVSGAGLPLQLPEVAKRYKKDFKPALIPIISSDRALELVCKRWKRAGYLPDAVVLEGPLAGGHLGWRRVVDINKEENRLENLLPPVLEVAKKYGGFPVIVAGGIYTHQDIVRFLEMGASGVQMGTRFLATYESGATQKFKDLVVNCKKEDIVVAERPGSPCKMLFRLLKDSPMYQAVLSKKRKPKCDQGYVLYNNYCPAMEDTVNYFCICNGLLGATIYAKTCEPPLYTVGHNAYRVDRIISVKELMAELRGD